MLLRVQADQDFRIARAKRSTRTVRLVNAGIWQADIVEHCLQLSPWNLLSERTLDLIAQAGRLFYAQSRTTSHMKPQQSGIDLREEVLSKKHEQPEREHAKQ